MNEVGLGITLKKLSKHEGEWTLEVERLVPLGNFLHQPIPQKIAGKDLIGRHLRAVPELKEMADVTEKLMLDETALDCYEIWEGSWVDEEMIQVLSPSKRKKSRLAGEAAATGASPRAMAKVMKMQDNMAQRLLRIEQGNVDGLAAKFDQMSRVLTSLSDRLKAIEDKLGLETPPEVVIPPVQSSGAPVKASPAPAPSPQSADAPVVPAASPTGETPPQPSPPAEATSEEPEPEEPSKPSADVPATPKPQKRMRIPPVGAMRKSLSMLIGEEVAFTEREERVDLSAGGFYRVTVLDDEKVMVGIMIADTEATIRLSSQLLMLPDSERDSQLESNEPTEDTTETMSEIFNTMSATINNVKNNPHVRTTPLTLMESNEFPWTETTKRRLEVDVEGGGVIVMCAI